MPATSHQPFAFSQLGTPKAGTLDDAARMPHRILVAVEAGWDSEELILWTSRLAGSLKAPWLVLYVETARSVSAAEASRLARNLDVARDLGAEVITTADECFVDAVLRVAFSRNVTQIVTWKPDPSPWWRLFRRDALVAGLVRGSGDIGVYVAPARRGASARPLRLRRSLAGAGWAQYGIVVGAVVLVALAGYLFTPRVEPHAMAFLSLLAVVILARFVERGPALLAAALTAGIWDYFFLPPAHAFGIFRLEDAFLLGMYFVVALALGQLTARTRAQEAAERQREGRSTALYLLGRELAEATTMPQIVHKVVAEMRRCFEAETAVLLADAGGELRVQAGSSLAIHEKDEAIAAWAFQNRAAAGRFTENLPASDALFFPLESSGRVIGVVGLGLSQGNPPTIHQRNLLEALTRQIALALDRQRLSELSENARLVAESERLGKTLLDSMSHEIRTPLSVINAAVTDFAEVEAVSAAGRELIGEIQEAAQRLNRLVGKVLDIARLESGHITPLFNECEVSEIVNMAVAETQTELSRHPLTVDLAPGLPIIRTDFVFLQQALMNVLSNAAVHTPPGTAVNLRVWSGSEKIFLEVTDHGDGLDPRHISRVFDKFYRGPAAPTGGTGLGLSLVKGFIEAIGGNVKAANGAAGGAAFTLVLPVNHGIMRPSVSI